MNDELKCIKEKLDDAHSIATEARDLARKNNEDIMVLNQSMDRLAKPVERIAEIMEDMSAVGRLGRLLNRIYTSKSIRGIAMTALIIWFAVKNEYSDIKHAILGWFK